MIGIMNWSNRLKIATNNSLSGWQGILNRSSRMKLTVIVALIAMTTSVQAECVILLHGLARNAGSMDKLAEQLTQHKYQVVNLGYPSRKHDIETLSMLAIDPALEQCDVDKKINFVTHSLGGILVRYYLSLHEIQNLHRVVMLGPPNQGSEVVDKLADVPGFYWINGDAGMQLGTDDGSVPSNLGEADFDVGIIAGTSSINLILSMLIPGVDDGKVAVERTKLNGMRDHIVMSVSHSFMMKNKQVIQQVLHYLKRGEFIHVNSDS